MIGLSLRGLRAFFTTNNYFDHEKSWKVRLSKMTTNRYK